MISGRLAKRYARALMALGQDQGIYERLGKELAELSGLADSSADLRTVIRAPIVKPKTREGILVAICKAMDCHEMTTRFVKFLNFKGRIAYLSDISMAYQELTDEVQGRVRAEVTSATPLSDKAEARIKETLGKLTGKEVVMKVDVDEDLIGGMVTRVAGKLFDGSVRAQLKAVEERLKSKAAD